ncbi:MAG: hypothetical protein ACI857_001418, partial [Arenicella sp.]
MKIIALFLTVLFISIGFSQRTPNKLNLHGTVLGYEFEPKTGIFKKDQIDIQGSVSGVKLEVLKGSTKITSTKTSSGGDFSLGIPTNGKYLLKYSKSGYGTSAIDIDLTGVPEDIARGGLLLKDIELLINDFESDKAIDNGSPFGSLYYSGDKFKFKVYEFERKEALFKKKEDNAPANVILTSVDKNRSRNKVAYDEVKGTDEIIEDVQEIINKEGGDTEIELISIAEFQTIKNSKLSDIASWKDLNKTDLTSRSDELAAAWDQIEKDKLIA